MLQVGASTLLIDEDTCATNFMIRDRRMEALIRKDKEPITPYLWRVRSLFEHLGVSSIMVIGGLGSYFDVADTVIAMDSYLAHDLTLQAKSISKQFAEKESSSIESSLNSTQRNVLGAQSSRFVMSQSVRCTERIRTNGLRVIQYGNVDIELGALEQLCEEGQTRAIADALQLVASSGGPKLSMIEIVRHLDSLWDRTGGLDALRPGSFMGAYARPRKFEIAAVINRYRKLKIV